MLSVIGTILTLNFWYENAFLAFTGLIVAVSAYTILKPDPIFPGQDDPTGNPDDWTLGEMRKWLSLRGLEPSPNATREELLERIKLNIRAPRVQQQQQQQRRRQ
ncbi:hypothetical protein BDZ91DRAFT_729461 [Kalaharituber pfeilii]|nr:hypothetical protein BDZ91DRAFT_729461 [Kalaharituber pfeilii]